MCVGRYVIRRGAVGCLLCLVASAFFCRLATAAEIPPFPLESYRLPNGLKVALSHDPTAPRTTVCVAYHVGSKNERAGLTGFAHFFEHMMFRGTEHVPNFDTPLQEAGGSPNAFTSQDVTVYFQTVPNHYVQRVIYMEADRMAFLATALDQEKFDTEREVVKNERRQTMENVPYGLAQETLASQVYPPGHPYSWSVIGSMRDLDNGTLDDLRDFFYEFYHPANATLTILGGFDPTETRAWIEEYFGPLAAGEAVAPPLVPPVAPRAERIIQKDRVQFPRVYWAWPTVADAHPDAPALGLLAMLLSSGDASRLQQALVIQSQSAVQADASSVTGELGGMFQISVTVAPDSEVEEVERRIADELARLQSVAPSEEELARSKRKHRTRSLIGLTSPMRRAIVIALGLAQQGDPEHFRAEFARYEAVTTADVQRVAREYLVADKTVLVVEPVSPGESQSEAVLVGPLPGPAREPVAARPVPTGPVWTRMPDPTSPTAFTPPAVSRRRLSNGLDVWIAPWNTLPLVSARLIVRAGSADDPPGQSGLATLTAQLWDQGTVGLTATELAEEIDALGTSLQIGADSDITQLGFTIERSVLPQTLALLGELITQPRFDPVDWAREQRLLLSALTSGPDDPSWIAQRVFPMLLYGRDHPFAAPSEGFTSTVESLTLDDVRRFYQAEFTPANAVLILVGDVDADEVLATLETHLSPWTGEGTDRTVPDIEDSSPGGTIYLVDRPGAVQSVILAGRLWRDRRDESFDAARVGDRVVGGDFLSRINQNLRERNGFTYGARSMFDFRRAGSTWTIGTSVHSQVTAAAVREILRELTAAAVDQPLTEEEVSTARNAELSLFPQAFETPMSIVSSLAQLAVFDLPVDYFRGRQERLERIERSAAARVTSELTDPSRIVVLVVGDRAAVEPELRAAGWDQIRHLDPEGRTLQDPGPAR